MLLTLVSLTLSAAEVGSVRVWLAPDNTRLVLDLSGPVEHTLFPLDSPPRIVIDVPDSRMRADLSELKLEGSPLSRVRSGVRKGDDLRIVLELNRKVQPRSFALKPNDQYGHRLVIDLAEIESTVSVKTVSAKSAPSGGMRDVVIAIDAGHGGEDPGALGPGGVREKDVVMAIAKELNALLAKEKGFKPVLIRNGDYYVELRKRTRLARRNSADLFVSIHADAFRDKRAHGASVWALSERGASSEMGRWLADTENNTDLIGGVGTLKLGDKDDLLAEVLLDMSMTASLSDSLVVADHVLTNMGRFARLHKNRVEQAGFVVLKSPDIPSILVETGFISNPREAKLLRSRSYQKKLARAVFDGIKLHFTRKPPAMTYLAWKKGGGKVAVSRYKVSRGDSLSVIAQRNGISLQQLRKVNRLKTDKIRVGQVLEIPVPTS